MDEHQTIKLMFWNSRSVLSKYLEFFDFLERHDVDVAVITETWLKKSNSFLHPNYHCIRLDRQNPTVDRGGGVAIVLRRGLSNCQTNIDTKIIEAVGVEIKSAAGNFTVIAAYFPGGNSRITCNKFQRDIETLTSRTEPFFVIGDFNARHRHWNCAKANKAGTLLFRKASTAGFFIHHSDEPTYHPAGRGRPSTLDLVLSNNLLTMSKPTVITDLSSDHSPVIFSVESRPLDPVPPHGYRRYDRADWRRFQRHLNDHIDLNAPEICRLETTESVDLDIENFCRLLTEAESVSIPFVPSSPYQVAKIPEPTRQLIRLRNCRNRQWKRNHNLFVRMITESLNNRIRAECAQARYRRFGETLETLEHGTKQLWKISKALRNSTKYSPPLKQDDRLIAAAPDKAQLLAETFFKAHTNRLLGSPRILADVEDSIACILESNPTVPENWLVGPREVRNTMKALKNKKAPGNDEIRNILLKPFLRKLYLC